MKMANDNTRSITKTHEHPRNKHYTLSAIKQEGYTSTGTIPLMYQYLQNIRIILSRFIIKYNTVHPCNMSAA